MTTLQISYEKIHGRFFAVGDTHKKKLTKEFGECEIPYSITAIGPKKCKPFQSKVRVNGKEYKFKVIPKFVETEPCPIIN